MPRLSVFSYKGSDAIMGAMPSRTSLIQITSQRLHQQIPLGKYMNVGVRFLTHELLGDTFKLGAKPQNLVPSLLSHVTVD